MEHTLSFEELDLIFGNHAPFLSAISDGPDNELRIVISAASVGEVIGDNGVTTNEALNDILSKCRPIMPDSHTLYEIFFENYIIYQTRNESWATYFPEEIRHGTFLITFEKSRLLDHLSEMTDVFKSDDDTWYPAKWIHYGIYTQNHVIDVISHCPPVISC